MRKMTAVVSALVLAGVFTTGCATKKYVGAKVAPVETKVAELDKKSTDHDAALKGHGDSIDAVERDLSRTKEKLSDTDARARAAAQQAEAANGKAADAMGRADNARSLAERGLKQGEEIRKVIDGVNTYKLMATQNVLFGRDMAALDVHAKELLDELGKSLAGVSRFVVEVQGYTDKTGNPEYNLGLSQRRAESVTRYLTAQQKLPLRSIHMLGSGVASEEQKTREERKLSRRVEVKIWVPEVDSAVARNSSAANATK